MSDNQGAAGAPNLEQALAEIEGLKEQLSGSDLKVFTQNRELRQENQKLREEVTRLTEECVTQTFAVRGLEKNKKALEKKVALLEARVAELESKVAELEGIVAGLEGKVAELEATNAQLESRGTELDARVADLTEEVGVHRSHEIHLSQELERTISTNAEEVSKLKSDYGQELETTKQTLEEARAQLERELSEQLEAKAREVQNLEQRVEAFKEEFLSQEFLSPVAASGGPEPGKAFSLLRSKMEGLLGFPGKTLVEQVFRHCGADESTSDPEVLEEAFEALQDTATKLVRNPEQEQELASILKSAWQELGLGSSESSPINDPAGSYPTAASEQNSPESSDNAAPEDKAAESPELASEAEAAQTTESEAVVETEANETVASEGETAAAEVAQPYDETSGQPEEPSVEGVAPEGEPSVVDTEAVTEEDMPPAPSLQVDEASDDAEPEPSVEEELAPSIEGTELSDSTERALQESPLVPEEEDAPGLDESAPDDSAEVAEAENEEEAPDAEEPAVESETTTPADDEVPALEQLPPAEDTLTPQAADPVVEESEADETDASPEAEAEEDASQEPEADESEPAGEAEPAGEPEPADEADAVDEPEAAGEPEADGEVEPSDEAQAEADDSETAEDADFEAAAAALGNSDFAKAQPIFHALRVEAPNEPTYLVGEIASLAGLERFEEAYAIGKGLDIATLDESAEVYKESYESVLVGLTELAESTLQRKLYLTELVNFVDDEERVLGYLDEVEQIGLRTPGEGALSLLQAQHRIGQDDVTEYLIDALASVSDKPEIFTLLRQNLERYPELAPLSQFLGSLLESSRDESLEAETSVKDLISAGETLEELLDEADPGEEALVQVFLEHLLPRTGVKVELPSEIFEDLLAESEPAAFVGALRQALRSVDYTLFFDEIEVLSYDGDEHFLLRSSPEPKPTLLFGSDVDDVPPEELRFLVLRELFSMYRRHSHLAHLAAQLDDALRFTFVKTCLDIHKEAEFQIPEALLTQMESLGENAAEGGQSPAFKKELENLLSAIYQATESDSILELSDFLYDGQLHKKWLDPLADGFAAKQTGLVVASFAIARDQMPSDDFEALEENGFTWLYEGENESKYRELRLRLQRLWSMPLKALVSDGEE